VFTLKFHWRDAHLTHLRGSRGFTLIELVITIAIVGVLTAISIPSFRTASLNSARTSASNELLGAFMLARTEAIKIGQDVTVCSSADGITCVNATSDWQIGVLVFADADEDLKLSGDEVAVTYTGAFPSAITATSNRKIFEFRPFNVRADNGTVFLCDIRGVDSARALIVNVSGRAHLAKSGEANVSWNCPS
jgi:type IV fimbrial biogenesis protein FimT